MNVTISSAKLFSQAYLRTMQSQDTLLVDVQFVLEANTDESIGGQIDSLSESSLTEWANRAYCEVRAEPAEMSLRIVGNDEIQELNKQYRDKDKTTNVLSFPFNNDDSGGEWDIAQWDLAMPILGDVVICWPVLVEEAQEQNKKVIDHLAHMVMHGVLHLCGFDHQNDEEAKQMEQLEVKLLDEVGISNPY